MSRRVPQSDPGFGSDSFLDVVANIVGILIILIVIAGVRVSQAPVLPQLNVAAAKPDKAPPEVVVVSPAPVEASEDSPLPAEPGPALVPPAPPPPKEPSPELIAVVSRLDSEIQSLSSDVKAAGLLLSQMTQSRRQTERELEQVAAALARESAALESQQQAAGDIDAGLLARRQQVKRLRFQLKKAKDDPPPVKQIRHELTPIGRTVEGKEVHFHLARNQVAFVPIEKLLDKLRTQVRRQKEWLTRFNSHHGSVGPVDGFSMNYVVVRQRLSVVEELRQGRGVMRIGVSGWQLIPERNLAAETAAEALRPGSAFHRALLTADPQSTLTFWVYPDSFEIYRTLQQVAHEEGLTVAGRPLPFGMPISGSPNGSRSSGQ